MKFVPVKPQEIFLDHLRREDNVMGLLGMGLGKTAACLQFITELLHGAEITGVLVVAPLRVINLTWPMEIREWEQFRWLKFANLRTDAGKKDFLNGTAHIYGTNYEAIPQLISLIERRRGTVPYQFVIWDESTRAKNPSSKRINLYRRKAPRVQRNLALTGTPMPNSWRDLFSQVRLVDNGARLGRDYQAFLREYFYCTTYGGYPKFEEKATTPDKLEKKIADITVTLKSSDWLNIPDMVVEDIELPFCKELQKKYERLERELVIKLRQDKEINIPSAAALVTKLLQFTAGRMYDDEKDVHPIHNLKMDALAKIAKQEEKPLLVACNFIHEQHRIREQFPEARFFADAKNETTQLKLIEDWNKKKIKMLVTHPASAGHGLNLQFGSNVIVWTTLNYSRELYEQFNARIARRGQTEITKVYRLMVPGTVDDAVAEVLASKAANEARLISALQMLESYRNNK